MKYIIATYLKNTSQEHEYPHGEEEGDVIGSQT